jgi:hypothetical protein
MRALAVGAMALSVFGAGAARAADAHPGDAFGVFKSYCIANHANAAAALKSAEAAGWTPVTQAEAPIPPQDGFKLFDYSMRMTFEGGNFRVLVVGSGEAVAGPSQPVYPVDICMVMTRPLDQASLDLAKAWAATPGTPVDPPPTRGIGGRVRQPVGAGYAFQDGPPNGHRGLHPGSDDAQAAMRAGKVSMLLTTSVPEKDLTVLGYVVTKLQ